MKRVGKISCLLIMFLLVIPLVLAVNTELIVKAPNNHKLSVSILKPGETYSLVDSFHKNVGGNKEVKVNFSTSLDEVIIGILLRFEGDTISYEKYGPYVTGGLITLDLIGESEEVLDEIDKNETGDVFTEQEETEEIEDESMITGSAVVSKIKDNSSKIIYFVIAIVFLAGALTFFVLKKRKGGKPIKIKKLSEIVSRKDSDRQALLDAERKLKEAQEEISRIVNKEDGNL